MLMDDVEFIHSNVYWNVFISQWIQLIKPKVMALHDYQVKDECLPMVILITPK